MGITHILLFLLFSFSTFCQKSVCLKGMINDKKSKEPLIGASIYLKKSNKFTTTDLDGYFEICGIQQNYTDSLKVSYVGYESLLKIIKTKQEDSLSFYLQLIPSENTQLADVIVKANLPISEDFVVTKMKFLDIVLNPSSSADPLLAVRSLPFSTTTDESANISLRGSSAGQTGIYLNDVPIYDAIKFAQLSGIGTFSIFNVNLIKNTLVFPSNPPVEYGNSGAGLISLTTDEKQVRNFAEFSIGLAQSGFMAGVNIGKKSMLKFFGNYQTHQGLKTITPKSFEELNSFKLEDIGFHWVLQMNKNWQSKFFIYAINENYSVVFPHPSLKEKENYDYQKNRFFYTSMIEKKNERYVLTFKHGFSQSSQNDFVGNYKNNQKNNDLFLGLDYHYFFSDRFTFKTGLSLDNRFFILDSSYPINSFDYRKESISLRDTSSFGRNINESYAYVKYLFSKKLTAGVGFRNNLTKIDYNYLSKQAHIRYNFNDKQFLNFSIGESNSFEKTSLQNFQGIKIFQYSLDYAFETENTKVAIALYKKNETFPSFLQKTEGIELFYRKMMKKWIFELSYSSIESKINENAGIYNSKYHLPFFLKKTVQLQFALMNIGLSTTYRSGTPFTPVNFGQRNVELDIFQPIYLARNSEILPAYFRSDLLLSKNIVFKNQQNGLIVYFNIGNIFDNENARDYNYNFNYSEKTPNLFQKRTYYFGFTYTLK